MPITLTLIIFISSILILFSAEFIKIFKRILEIKGAKVVIPLFLASWLVYSLNYWFLWAIFYTREILSFIFFLIVKILPFKQGAESFVLIILLTLISIIPVIIMDLLSRRKTFKGYKYPYLTSTLIWILLVFLLVVT